MDEGTRRFISIVVVAMVLLAGLMTALTLLPHPEGNQDEEEEDPGWRYQNENYGRIISVYDDVTWSGWNQSLTTPVRIEVGSTLTIEDSHIELPLEALIFNYQSPFHIRWDGGLVLRNSTLEVEADPQLEMAVYDQYSEIGNPVIWRVVNLRDAIEPVMEVELMLMRGWTSVVVAAQMTPDDPLQPLEVVTPEEVELFQWSTLRLPLTDYIGGTPRLAVFLHNSSTRDAMISDIRVTDWDKPLPGDVFSTGDLKHNGWTMENLISFKKAVNYNEHHIKPIIDGYGDLRVDDSQVLSLPGLARNVRSYRPQAWGGQTTTWKVAEEGCINVTGNITFRASDVEYVPIKWTGGFARFRDCSFVGDADLMALAGSVAMVLNCDFAFETREGLWTSGLRDEEVWMLSFELGGAQQRVEGCTFTGEGEGIGLVVNHASIYIDDCEFSNLAAAVWDHETIIPMSWNVPGASVSFSQSCNVFYLETREVHVELDGPGEPDPWESRYTRWSYERFEEVPGLEDLYMMEMRNDHFSKFALPSTVIGPSMGKLVLEEVNVTIQPSWINRYRTVTLDPDQTYVTLWLDDTDIEPTVVEEHYAIWDWTLDVGQEVGVLSVIMGMTIDGSVFSEAYLNISVDGVLVDVVNLTASDINWTSYDPYFVLEQTIPPGPHNLTIVVGGVFHTWGWIIEIDRLTTWVYRADSDHGLDEAREWLENRSLAALMVDPYTDGGEFSCEVWAPYYHSIFSILTWEGSDLVVDRISCDSSSWGTVVLAGNGTVVLRTLEIPGGGFNIKNCTSTIGSVNSTSFLSIEIRDADVMLEQRLDVGYLSTYLYNGSRFRVVGVDVEVWNRIEWVALMSDFIISDCTFTRTNMALVEIGSAYGSNLTVEGCTFLDVPLLVDLYDMNDTVSIIDCSFEGRNARLVVLPAEWSEDDDPELDVPWNGSISGNLFSGPGADLVVDTFVRDRMLSENIFNLGARSYIQYAPNVSIHIHSQYYRYNITTLDSYVFMRAGYVPGSRSETRFNYLVDMTDAPSGGTDPGYVPVVIRIEWAVHGFRRGVVGFTDVPIASPTFTVQAMTWDSIHNDIEDLEQDFNIANNWWTS
jgi:hypothetical protein